MKDFQAIRALQTKEKAAQLRKVQTDKRKAEEMRHAAMEGMSS